MTQPVKTMASRLPRGTKSLMRGVRASVRLPRRMVPIWVVDPMGLAMPRRIASTPAMRVVATAPMPGIMMPSFPVAGLMLAASSLLAAPGVDMLGSTLLWFNFPLKRTGQYRLWGKPGANRALRTADLGTSLAFAARLQGGGIPPILPTHKYPGFSDLRLVTTAKI